MTTAFLDTNILIDYFSGHLPAKAAMEQYEYLKLPSVTYIEFMAGIKTRAQEDAADKVINILFEIVHTDQAICKETAYLRQQYRVKLPDLMIYATARVHGGVLLTRNTKDFNERFEAVHIPYQL